MTPEDEADEVNESCQDQEVKKKKKDDQLLTKIGVAVAIGYRDLFMGTMAHIISGRLL